MPSFGNLFASLTLQSASFMSGIKAAQKEMRQTQKTFQRVGKRIAKVGLGFSAAVTAPLAGVGAAFVASAQRMADNIPELERVATTAGTSVAQFQRLAFAASKVGIEQDKLGDVFKDTQDKIGEFIATGGGEMQDFFTNVAPKVGVTAEAFKNLSGPQALQLYYDTLQKAGVSQAQQVFYMEAIADEASGLIPLLKDGGAQFAEFGKQAAVLTPEDVARLKDYRNATDAMKQAFQKLTIALVSSGLLEQLTDLITKVAGIAGEMSKANPTLFKFGIIAGGIAAAIGPFLLGLGGLVSGFAALLPYLPAIRAGITAVRVAMLAFLANPIVLGAAAVIAGIYLAWKNWDTIGPILKRLYTAAKTWIIDKLIPIINGVLHPIETVKNAFFNLYDAVVGHSYIPDMVTAIGEHMARLNALMVEPARAATSKTAQAFQALQQRVSGILDRLFPEQAAFNQLKRDIDDLTANAAKEGWSPAQLDEAIRRARTAHYDALPDPKKGPFDVAPEIGATGKTIAEQAGKAAEAVTSKWAKAQAANDNLIKSFAEMARDVASSLQSLVSNIKSGDWLGALQSVLDIVGQVAGIIKGTGTPAARTFSLNGARAMGGPVLPHGNYLVGEQGPEILRMGSRGGSIVANDQICGPTRVEIVPSPYFDARVDGRAATIARPIAMQTSVGVQSAVGRRRQRSLAT